MTQEPHPWCCLLNLSPRADLRKYSEDVGLLGDIDRVGFGSHEEEMVPKVMVAWRQSDALVDGNFLRCRAVGDADVNEPRLEILNAAGGDTYGPLCMSLFMMFRVLRRGFNLATGELCNFAHA